MTPFILFIGLFIISNQIDNLLNELSSINNKIIDINEKLRRKELK